MSDTKNSILLIEDDEHLVKVLKLFFTNSNFSITSAANGVQALEILKNSSLPNIIICDIMMPKMDGYQFRRTVLKKEDLKMIPFIFLTAKGRTPEKITGLEMGVDDYVTKPFEIDELLARVNAILKRHKSYKKLIQYDGLTNLYNRSTIEEKVNQEVHRVRRYKITSSVVLLDIDHFKQVNDSFGHNFGDEVLIKIAKTILEQLREVDVAGRYGGEEFVILMPETEKETAWRVSERLRKKISVLTFDSYDCKITTSGGVSSAPEDGMELKDIIEKADVALYQAKNSGRNRIIKFKE